MYLCVQSQQVLAGLVQQAQTVAMQSRFQTERISSSLGEHLRDPGLTGTTAHVALSCLKEMRQEFRSEEAMSRELMFNIQEQHLGPSRNQDLHHNLCRLLIVLPLVPFPIQDQPLWRSDN